MIPRTLNAPLSWIGLMRVSEHEELIGNSVAFHLRNYRSLERHRDDLKAELASLRPDAEAMRRKRANDAANARLKRRGNK